MDQQPLEDVGVTAQVSAAHAPGVIEVCERAFDQFAAPPHQTPSAYSTNPATIPIHRRLGLGRLRPVASTPVWLCDVRAEADGGEVNHGLIAVIPLVGDDLVERL